MEPEDCVCFYCVTHKHIMAGIAEGEDGMYDCACDSGPVYDAEACGKCDHRATCDVPKNPQNYSLHSDNGQGS